MNILLRNLLVLGCSLFFVSNSNSETYYKEGNPNKKPIVGDDNRIVVVNGLPHATIEVVGEYRTYTNTKKHTVRREELAPGDCEEFKKIGRSLTLQRIKLRGLSILSSQGLLYQCKGIEDCEIAQNTMIIVQGVAGRPVFTSSPFSGIKCDLF